MPGDFESVVGIGIVVEPAYLLTQIQAITPPTGQPAFAFAVDKGGFYTHPGGQGNLWTAVPQGLVTGGRMSVLVGYSSGGMTPIISAVQGVFQVGTTAPTTVQLLAQTFDQNNNLLSGRTYTWGTSNSAVATVSVAGLVTGVAIGFVTITANDTGVVGFATGTVSTVPTTLAAAMNLNSKKATVSVNVNYQTPDPNKPWTQNYQTEVWNEFAGAGGMVTEEVAFQERFIAPSVNNVGTINFNFAGSDGQVTKAKNQTTRVRWYLLQASLNTAPWMSTWITNAATALSYLNAYIDGVINHNVTTFGTAGSGNGVLDYNINEIIWGDGSYRQNQWNTYLGAPGWINTALKRIATDDSTAVGMVNATGIEPVGSAAGKTGYYNFLNQLSGQSGIPSTMVAGYEFHVGWGGYTYTAQDVSALVTHWQAVAALGFKIAITEYDNGDQLAQGQGAAGFPTRDAQNNTNLSNVLQAASEVWSSIYSIGVWQVDDVQSWLNNPPNSGAPIKRTDGAQLRPCLKNNNSFKGGQGSTQDIYSLLLNFFAAQAA